MKIKSLFFAVLIPLFFAPAGKAQEALPPEEQPAKTDTIVVDKATASIPTSLKVTADSLAASENGVLEKKAFKPNPQKAVWLALVLGLGQIYNRKYWKLPIVYGGFMGCTYAITWNNRTYKDYMAAYKEFMEFKQMEIDHIPLPNRTPLWHNYVPPGTSPDAVKGRMEDYLKRNKDTFRRYRDLSVIVTAAVYLLSIVDAYVDAQLYDFDISPDLGMRVEPAIFDRSPANAQAYGLQCNIKF